MPWKGIAITGIWIGVGISAFGISDAGAVVFVALFAMCATIAIARR